MNKILFTPLEASQGRLPYKQGGGGHGTFNKTFYFEKCVIFLCFSNDIKTRNLSTYFY